MESASNNEDNKSRLARKYSLALRRYLKETTRAKPAAALKLGQEAAQSGLSVLELAAIHEEVLIEDVLATKNARERQRIMRRGAKFFGETIVPIEETHRTAQENNSTLLQLNRELEQRTRDISASHQKLTDEIAKRKAVEEELRKSKHKSNQLLLQSQQLQEELRRLSHGILSSQEEERKRISRELHDLVAQTLTAINVHLANLKREATQNARGINENIAYAQKLVEQSVDKVHRFARELRPAVLDDLGLIPAMRSFAEILAEDKGVYVNITACAKVEELNSERRTVLYRVAQEALTNVVRHAQAKHVTVDIKELSNAICMRIHDDGRAFDVERLLNSRKNKRLGLLGMRERVEMVGGTFTIESAPDQGTTVTARVPIGNEALEENQR